MIGVGGTGSEHGYPAVPLRLDLQPRSTDEETEAQRAQMTCGEFVSPWGRQRWGGEGTRVASSRRGHRLQGQSTPIPFYSWKRRTQSGDACPKSHSASAAESAGNPGIPKSQPWERAGAQVDWGRGDSARSKPLWRALIKTRAALPLGGVAFRARGFHWAFVCGRRDFVLDGRWRRGLLTAGALTAGLHPSVTQARARAGRSRDCRSSAPSGGGLGRGRVLGGAVPRPARSRSSGQRREGPAPGCE